MTTDEIVNALKLCAGDRCCEGCIEEQSVRHWQIVMREAADLIESMQAQLAESKRREKAAVEFIKYLDRNYSGYMAEDERFSKWRGPQEAGKGETE